MTVAGPPKKHQRGSLVVGPSRAPFHCLAANVQPPAIVPFLHLPASPPGDDGYPGHEPADTTAQFDQFLLASLPAALATVWSMFALLRSISDIPYWPPTAPHPVGPGPAHSLGFGLRSLAGWLAGWVGVLGWAVRPLAATLRVPRPFYLILPTTVLT